MGGNDRGRSFSPLPTTGEKSVIYPYDTRKLLELVRLEKRALERWMQELDLREREILNWIERNGVLCPHGLDNRLSCSLCLESQLPPQHSQSK